MRLLRQGFWNIKYAQNHDFCHHDTGVKHDYTDDKIRYKTSTVAYYSIIKLYDVGAQNNLAL